MKILLWAVPMMAIVPVAGAAPVMAQAVSAPTGSPLSQAMLTCLSKVNDAERLKCYDAAASSLSPAARAMAERREQEAAIAAAATAAAAAKAAEAEAAARAERKKQEFGKADAASEERITELVARVSEAFTDSQRRQVFLLDNGQMWRQTDGVMTMMVRPGTEVELKRGALGSYRITIPSIKRTVPVMRIR